MSRALTLVEVLISGAILLVLLASVIVVLNVENQNWQFEEGMVDLQQQTRLAMNGMVREIRQGTDINITGGGSNVEFLMPNSTNSVKYSLSSGQIIREHPVGTTKVLANNINSINFCCWGNDGTCGTDCSFSTLLQIKLRASKSVGQRVLIFPAAGNWTEQVRLRNE